MHKHWEATGHDRGFAKKGEKASGSVPVNGVEYALGSAPTAAWGERTDDSGRAQLPPEIAAIASIDEAAASTRR